MSDHIFCLFLRLSLSNLRSLPVFFFWCWKGLSGWLSGQIVFLEAPSSEDWAISIKAVERDPHFFGSGSLSPSIHYLALVDGFQNRNIGNYGKTWRTCETHEICFVYVLLLFVGLFVCCVWSLFWLFVCFSIVCLFVCLFVFNCLFVCLLVCLFVCLVGFVCLFVCLFV